MQFKATRLTMLLLVIILAGSRIKAQNITRSPYSIIGIGDQVFPGNSAGNIMGQTSQGIRNPFSVNILNPASYSSMVTTCIEAGATFSNGILESSNQKNRITNSWISSLAFGIPLNIKKGMGMSFGLTPYSGVGYNLQSTAYIPQDTFTIQGLNNYMGRGGISRIYAGYGMKMNRRVSLGINANYLFGQVKNTSQLLIPSQYNMFNTNTDKISHIHGWIMDYGIQYHDTISTFSKKQNKRIVYEYSAGFTYTPSVNLNAEQDEIIRSLPIGYSSGIKDTVFYKKNVSGLVTSPASWKAGISFGQVDKWTVAADVRGTQWSTYKSFGAKDSLRNSIGAGIGASYLPGVKESNILKRTEYRVGARYEKSNLSVYGQGVDIWSVSAGIGLPVGYWRSRLNIGAEYSKRGSTNNGLVKESYFRIIIGISFADKWFYRYRYD